MGSSTSKQVVCSGPIRWLYLPKDANGYFDGKRVDASCDAKLCASTDKSECVTSPYGFADLTVWKNRQAKITAITLHEIGKPQHDISIRAPAYRLLDLALQVAYPKSLMLPPGFALEFEHNPDDNALSDIHIGLARQSDINPPLLLGVVDGMPDSGSASGSDCPSCPSAAQKTTQQSYPQQQQTPPSDWKQSGNVAGFAQSGDVMTVEPGPQPAFPPSGFSMSSRAFSLWPTALLSSSKKAIRQVDVISAFLALTLAVSILFVWSHRSQL